MIVTVLHIDGLPPPQPIAFDFKERGGCIGRHPHGELVLPDTRRYVSRIHAQIEYHGHHQYALIALGANPMTLAGERLPIGEERVLRGGEHITIGHFELLVIADQQHCEVGHAAVADADPFAVFSPRRPTEHNNKHPLSAPAPTTPVNPSVWDALSVNSASIDHLLTDHHPSPWLSPAQPLPYAEEQPSQLLAAFRRGLGLNSLGSGGLNVAWMEKAGRLLRESLLAEKRHVPHQLAATTSVQDNSNS